MKRGLFFIAMMALAAVPARANTLAVVASSPADGSSSIGIEATVTFTFNFPVDPELIQEAFIAEPAGKLAMGEVEVSGDGRTVRFDVTHQPGTDYVWIVSGAHEDAGTGILEVIDPYVLRYSTDANLGASEVHGRVKVRSDLSGGMEGRRLPLRFEVPMDAPLFKEMSRSGKERIKDGAPSDGQGMPTSQFVDPNPTRTVVILSAVDPLTTSDEEAIAGAAIVTGEEGDYAMPYVRPGRYYPYAMKVGVVEPNAPLGDLLGAMYFGYYDPDRDGTPDAIDVPASGSIGKIDFMIAPLSYYAGTAGEMQVAARQAADHYASDQELVGATTFGLGRSGSSAMWTYNYYSPSTGLQTDVTVTPFDIEVVPTEYAGSEPPAALPMPFVDSDQAYVVGLMNGGESFLADYPHAFAGMSAGIAHEAEMGSETATERPYWAVAFVAIEEAQIDYLVVYVDFLTGEFLGSERSQPIAGRYSDRFPVALQEVSAVNGSFALVGMHAEDVTEAGVATNWRFDFYAEDTDTRAIVMIAEGHSAVESETPAGRPEVVPLARLIIDSDFAVASAMEQGGSAFIEAHGKGRITLDAGDLSATFPWLSRDPMYLVTVYGADASADLSFRAVLDPATGQLVHSERSGGTASDPETEVPESVTLGANYPNPFNPQTTIPFELTTSAPARLTVHDALGRQVAVLVDGAMPAGSHTTTWDAANHPSGVYFYRLTSAGQMATGKMILQK